MAANTPGKQADVRLGISYGRQSTQLAGLLCARSGRRASQTCRRFSLDSLGAGKLGPLLQEESQHFA
jgi:hypothetical protein